MGLQSRFCFLLLFLPLCVFAAERHISAEIIETADEKQSADLTGSTAAQAEQFRMDFWKKVRRGTAVRKDYDACKNFLEHLESDKQNRQFCILLYILLAQYHRTIDREPVKSLEILAPFILEPETASQWITNSKGGITVSANYGNTSSAY
ncbi:hypothetical protein FACS18942_00060 [Planctomycetales bacterium]|nr:hypothetical protein FACS18942_00060 [Planctomycetales bacterium]